GKSHDDQTDQSPEEHDRKLSAVDAADVKVAEFRQCDCDGYRSQHRVDGKRNIRQFDFQDGHPEAGLFFRLLEIILVLTVLLPHIVKILEGDKEQVRCTKRLDLQDIDENSDHEKCCEAEDECSQKPIEKGFFPLFQRQVLDHDRHDYRAISSQQPLQDN